MTRSFKTVLFLTLGLLLMGLAACSAEEAPGETRDAVEDPVAQTARAQSPAPQPAAVQEPAPTGLDRGTPRRGGHLVLASMADYPHRDVHRSAQETLATLGPGLAYSRLLRLETGREVKQPNLTLQCDLCESWELAPDMSYVFRLRSDVYWQDLPPVDGRQLVADDLVFSYDRMRAPGWPGEARFADRGIGEIEALDDHTLRVSLEFRDSDALLALADGHSKIVAPEVLEQFGGLLGAPVIGTGPWVFEQKIPGGATEYSRNPNYFEPDLPYLDVITVKPVTVASEGGSVNPERLALLEAGQIDVVVASPTDWPHLERSSVEFNSRVSQQPEIGMVLTLNAGREPLDNLAVRQAIFRALDPWEYVDLDWSGQGGVGLGMPIRSSGWQLGQGELLAGYLGSHSAARDILQDNEIIFPPALEIAVADLGPDYRQVGNQIVRDLEAVGFEANVTAMDPAALQATMFGVGRDYQIALTPAPPHPTTNGYLYSLLHSGGPGNIANHDDKALDALIEVQAGELDPARRQEWLLDLQRHTMEQAYMFSPITGSYRWVFDWDLENFYPNTALSEYHYWAEAWLRQ